jgi:TonB-dependent starch-binding outer membrane protein SusC
LQGSVTKDGKPAAGLLFLDPRFDKRKQNTNGLLIEHKLGENLTQRFVLGYDVNQNTESFYERVGAYNTPTGNYQETEWSHWTASLDYGATFRTSFRGGGISSVTSAGFQAAQDVDKRVSVESAFFPGPVEVPTLTSGATRRISSDSRLKVINAGFFFQQLFGYKEVLFLTAGLRVDGNSAFGESFGLQPYPKVSLSWILSDLDFWPEWSESFKLRAAMGDAGKAPGAFDAVRSWGAIVADQGKPGFTPGAVGNPNLGPERTREYEIGSRRRPTYTCGGPLRRCLPSPRFLAWASPPTS